MATTIRPKCTVAADADECLVSSNHVVRRAVQSFCFCVHFFFFTIFRKKLPLKFELFAARVWPVVVVIDTVHAKLKLLLCVRIFIQFVFFFACSLAFYYFFIFNANWNRPQQQYKWKQRVLQTLEREWVFLFFSRRFCTIQFLYLSTASLLLSVFNRPANAMLWSVSAYDG